MRKSGKLREIHCKLGLQSGDEVAWHPQCCNTTAMTAALIETDTWTLCVALLVIEGVPLLLSTAYGEVH